MQNRYIQSTYEGVASVSAYSEIEVAEIFSASEVLWLSQGKIVEGHQDASHVDLQAFFDANQKET